MSGPGAVHVVGEVALEDRRAERDGAEAGEVVGGVIGQADHRVGKRLAELHHRAQPHQVRRRRIEIGRVQQRVRHAGALEDRDRLATLSIVFMPVLRMIGLPNEAMCFSSG